MTVSARSELGRGLHGIRIGFFQRYIWMSVLSDPTRVIHNFGTTAVVLLEIFLRGTTTLLDKWIVVAVLAVLACFKPHQCRLAVSHHDWNTRRGSLGASSWIREIPSMCRSARSVWK